MKIKLITVSSPSSPLLSLSHSFSLSLATSSSRWLIHRFIHSFVIHRAEKNNINDDDSNNNNIGGGRNDDDKSDNVTMNAWQ